MRIIDKYILKEIAFPIMFCLYVLIFLFIIADLFDHLYEIINNKTPLKDILTYYMFLIPFAYVQTISWATFLGTVYIFTFLNRHGEIVAMKALGLKITKIAGPILFLGFIIGVITFIINDRIVPYTFHRAQQIKKEKIEMSEQANRKEVIKNAALLVDNRQYFIKYFDSKNNIMEDIRVHILDENNFVKYKVAAQRAEWLNEEWVFQGVSIYQLDRYGRIIGEPEVAQMRRFPEFVEHPHEFIEASIDSAFLSSKHLENHIKRLEENGLSVNAEYSALHNKRAFPWQSLVIMIITIPILGRTTDMRKGFAKNILICMSLVFCYHVLSAISLALGTSGLILPFLSAWLANISFTAGGIFFLEKANF